MITALVCELKKKGNKFDRQQQSEASHGAIPVREKLN